MNLNYLERLGKEWAMKASEQRAFKGVRLEEKAITIDNIDVKDKNLTEKIKKLSDKEKQIVLGSFDRELIKILELGIRRQTVNNEVSQKWK